ncbi:MAG: L,D-transpeptidase family protein [Hungatella sp.]
MRKLRNKVLIFSIAAVMSMTGVETAVAANGFVNEGPGVALETKPAETPPAETNPAETNPAETKPAETPPVGTNPAETKPAESGAVGEETPSHAIGSNTTTGENNITYKTIAFTGLNARFQMGVGTQITNVVLSLQNIGGNIAYDAYVNNGGWQPWTFNDQPTGGTENSTYLEGVRIMPRAGLEKQYDVYYACTMSGLGKLAYAKNGEMSGAPGRGEHVTDIDIVLVPRGGAAPGNTTHPFFTVYHDKITNKEGVLTYADPAYTGWLDQEGYRFYVNNGQVLTGWQYIDGFKYYFAEDGLLVQDVDAIIGKQPSYLLKINKAMNCLTVYAPDGANGYIIPVKAMVTSVGDDTPIGTFPIPEKYRWRQMVTGAYAQYASRIKRGAGYLLHSVIYDVPNNHTLWTDTYNGLGVLRSMGCVRLTTGNAKWIFDHCAVGTNITVYESEIAGAFPKPGTIPIPAGQNYDPTDPNA